MFDWFEAWLKERRRWRPEREANEYAELIRQSYRYARYDRALASIVAYHRRKRPHNVEAGTVLPSAVSRAYWTTEGK
jgi:hypothetical protein